MIHLAFMKFCNESLTPELLVHIQHTFASIKNNLNGCISAKVYENCITRGSNYHLMIGLELESQDVLEKYLTHPEHIALEQKLRPLIKSFGTFDYQ